jgi:hypothetical protein
MDGRKNEMYIKAAAATKYIETSQMKRTNFDGEGTEQADGFFTSPYHRLLQYTRC